MEILDMRRKAVLGLIALLLVGGTLAASQPPASAHCGMDMDSVGAAGLNPMQQGDLNHLYRKRQRAYERWLANQYNNQYSANSYGYPTNNANSYGYPTNNANYYGYPTNNANYYGYPGVYGYNQIPPGILGNSPYNPYGYNPGIATQLRSLLGF